MESFENHSGLKFAHLAPEVWKKLGDIPRTGWVRRGIENPETVQEHTLALQKLVTELSNALSEFSAEEKEELMNILEVHDWPEALEGDQVTVTADPVERKKLKEEKFIAEHKAMITITKSLGEIGQQILSLWLRFESSNDALASFARQLDKYQAVEKAYEYETLQDKSVFKEFADYAAKDITHPILVERIADMRLK